MNRIVALSLCVVMSGWAVREVTRATGQPVVLESATHIDDLACCPHDTVASVQQQTAGNNSDALVLVDDATLMKRISDQATLLIDQGKAVDVEVLLKQLESDQCKLDLAPAQGAALDPATLYQSAKESVVVVAGIFKCPRCDNWHAAPASGFVVSADGAIVTSYHVVNESDKKTFVVMTADGHVRPVTRILASNKADDLAILKIDAEGLKPLPIAESVAIGTPVHVLSHPSTHFFSFSSGLVSRSTNVRVGDQPVSALEITADFARGSSGAPVLNAQGQVVGVVRSTESVYYSMESGQQRNLQMVFKVCVPSKSLRKLAGG